MHGAIGISRVEASAMSMVCPHIVDGRTCDGRECPWWEYVVPLPELDDNRDVVMLGEGWVCALDEYLRPVNSEVE